MRTSPGSAPGKIISEIQDCRTRTTTARPCLLSINTPCDHISASRTSSTHASASAKGLGTLRKGCCSAAAQPFSTTQCAYYRHTSDPLSLDTTDQWVTPRLLLTEAPACRPPEAQAPRHRLHEHAPEDRQDRHPPGVNFNQWSLPFPKPLIITPLLTLQLRLHQMRLLPLRNLPPRTCLNSYFQQAFQQHLHLRGRH